MTNNNFELLTNVAQIRYINIHVADKRYKGGNRIDTVYFDEAKHFLSKKNKATWMFVYFKHEGINEYAYVQVEGDNAYNILISLEDNRRNDLFETEENVSRETSPFTGKIDEQINEMSDAYLMAYCNNYGCYNCPKPFECDCFFQLCGNLDMEWEVKGVYHYPQEHTTDEVFDVLTTVCIAEQGGAYCCDLCNHQRDCFYNHALTSGYNRVWEVEMDKPELVGGLAKVTPNTETLIEQDITPLYQPVEKINPRFDQESIAEYQESIRFEPLFKAHRDLKPDEVSIEGETTRDSYARHKKADEIWTIIKDCDLYHAYVFWLDTEKQKEAKVD